MSRIFEFLDAVFVDAESSLVFEGDSVVRVPADEVLDYVKTESPVAVSPVDSDGFGYFVFGPEDICDLPPTARLVGKKDSLAFWAYDRPCGGKTHNKVADAFEMQDAGEFAPLPMGDWRLDAVDFDAIYSPKELLDGVSPPWDEEASTTYGDASIVSPYDESSSVYAQKLTITNGSGRESVKWKPAEMPVGQLVAVLCQHKEGPKDGLAFVLADMVPGRRLKTAVKACYGIGLDLDTGVPTENVDRALKGLGCLAVRYTTHSHNKSRTDFKKDALAKWITKTGEDLDPTDDETLRRYVAEVEGWHRTIVDSVRYSETTHEDRGIIIWVDHKPMPKHRIIVPLKTPYVIADQAGTQQEAMKAWGKIPTALAQELGLPLDESCLDPSRLFYYPRHAKGKPFSISLFGGPLFDYRKLELDDPWDEEVAKLSKGTSKSQTDAGKQLGKWSMKAAHGFQVVQAIEDHSPDKLRHQTATGWEIECPFDEEHSNPGDPEDRACLAVNAGDGPSEWFTVKCQHESCKSKTNLDMLGKMLADDWFPRDVLDDESYNIAELEDAPNPEAAKRIDKEDKAKAAWQGLCESLTKDSTSEEIEEAYRTCVEAALNPLDLALGETLISKSTGHSKTTLKGLFKKVQIEVERERNEASDDSGDPLHRAVFYHGGEFNFDEAFEICYKSLRHENRKLKKPLFCCVQDQAVRLTENPNGRLAFQDLTPRSMWAALNERVTFIRKNEKGEMGNRQQVPLDVATQVYEQAYQNDRLPQAPEIVYTPLFVKSEKFGCEVISEPGWYRDLDLMLADTGFEVPEIPAEPTPEDVDAAVEFLTENMLGDFPFLDYDLKGNKRREPSLANALAMIITPFMRRLIDSCTPVFFISKPMPGTGGTLLGMVPIILCDGEEPAPEPYTQNEEEMRKSLLASILETRSHLFYDDVSEFNNRVLLQSITAKHIGGRLLGATKTVQRPNRFNWIATGNNPDVKSEMERRVVWIRLNAETDDIQHRVFRHDNFMQWLKENREVAVYHILTLIQHWIACGMPRFKQRKRASFEDWSEKVGGVLECAGIDGFLDNRRQVGADAMEHAIRMFIKEWLRKWGVGAQVNAIELFTFALDNEMDICEGNNDDQKKGRFYRRLPLLVDRTFTINEKKYTVRMLSNAEEETVYSILESE